MILFIDFCLLLPMVLRLHFLSEKVGYSNTIAKKCNRANFIMNSKMINSRGEGISFENLAHLGYGFSGNFFFLPNSEHPSLHSSSLTPLSLHLSSCVWWHLGLFEFKNVFLASKSSFRFLKSSMAWEKSSQRPIYVFLKRTYAGLWDAQNMCLYLQ